MDRDTYVPQKLRKLRSCIGCGLLQTEDWWDDNACPNCEVHGRRERWTSASFSGMISIFRPKDSWCAQWNRFHFNVAGMYALDNAGEVTEEIIRHLDKKQRPLPEWVERGKAALLRRPPPT